MGTIRGVPHPFPYQGSKRQLASQIIACIPCRTSRLIEPFVGSGAITIAAAYRRRANTFIINDIHEPLMALWKAIINYPRQLSAGYQKLWKEQEGREREFYNTVRERFNETHEAHLFLFLLARCVKAAVRYNDKGEFNNSPDHRRLGMRPDTMRRNILHTSELLKERVKIECRDYQDILAQANRQDVVYMDPPYQGVCDTRDHRYCKAVSYNAFVNVLSDLNRRKVSYIVSYDGRTGSKNHGRPLPTHLKLVRFELRVGRSTQATLLGRNHETFESLYLSPAILDRLDGVPDELEDEPLPSLFASL